MKTNIQIPDIVYTVEAEKVDENVFFEFVESLNFNLYTAQQALDDIRRQFAYGEYRNFDEEDHSEECVECYRAFKCTDGDPHIECIRQLHDTIDDGSTDEMWIDYNVRTRELEVCSYPGPLHEVWVKKAIGISLIHNLEVTVHTDNDIRPRMHSNNTNVESDTYTPSL